MPADEGVDGVEGGAEEEAVVVLLEEGTGDAQGALSHSHSMLDDSAPEAEVESEPAAGSHGVAQGETAGLGSGLESVDWSV